MATTTKKTPERACARGAQLDEARAALTGLGAHLRTGGRDLYGDVETLMRSTSRDTVKLVKAIRGDVDRLAKAGVPPHVPPKPLKTPKPLPRVAPPARRRKAPAHA